MTDSETSGNAYLFDIALYLAICALNLIKEPPKVGPFRLIDALSKLVDLPKYTTGLDEDPFLSEIKEIIDEKKFLLMYDEQEFQRAIEEIVERFAKELKKRYLETK